MKPPTLLRSFSFLPATTANAACRSPPAATVPFPITTALVGRRRCRLAAGRTNGSLSPDEFCPVDCVTEFKTFDELQRYLDRSKATGTLVVVDFYRTACGSCKYIEKGFMRLCKGSRDDGAPVVFLKHNVLDEYDEKSEVADWLQIRVVPMFQFYKDGELVESFATRDKQRIIAAIQKYTSLEPAEATGEERQE